MPPVPPAGRKFVRHFAVGVVGQKIQTAAKAPFEGSLEGIVVAGSGRRLEGRIAGKIGERDVFLRVRARRQNDARPVGARENVRPSVPT